MGARVHWFTSAIVLVLTMALVRPLAAQDVAQLIATGDQHLAAYRYAQALERFTAIPDHTATAQLFSKHAGIAMSLMGLGRLNGVEEHVAAVMRLAAAIGTDASLARAENINGQYQRQMRIGDHGIAAYLRAADHAIRGGNNKALA